MHSVRTYLDADNIQGNIDRADILADEILREIGRGINWIVFGQVRAASEKLWFHRSKAAFFNGPSPAPKDTANTGTSVVLIWRTVEVIPSVAKPLLLIKE